MRQAQVHQDDRRHSFTLPPNLTQDAEEPPFRCVNSFHRPNLRFAVHHSKTTRGHTILTDLAPYLGLDAAAAASSPSPALDDQPNTLTRMWQQEARQQSGDDPRGAAASLVSCPICGAALKVRDTESRDDVVGR